MERLAATCTHTPLFVKAFVPPFGIKLPEGRSRVFEVTMVRWGGPPPLAKSMFDLRTYDDQGNSAVVTNESLPDMLDRISIRRIRETQNFSQKERVNVHLQAVEL